MAFMKLKAIFMANKLSGITCLWHLWIKFVLALAYNKSTPTTSAVKDIVKPSAEAKIPLKPLNY